MLKGKRKKSLVSLRAGDSLTLSLAGHAIQLSEVLAIENDAFKVARGELIRLVDNPAGHTETHAARRERITTCVQLEKAKGLATTARMLLRLLAQDRQDA